MKNLLNILLVVTIFTFSSCEKTDSSRFEKEEIGSDKMEILKDTETGLTWVNDTRGCFAAIIEPGTECADLSFAGRDDWRNPTASEMSVLIKAINDAEMKLNYINTSCAMMSTSEDKWVFTENSTTPGDITTNKPGNAGLRCVTK